MGVLTSPGSIEHNRLLSSLPPHLAAECRREAESIILSVGQVVERAMDPIEYVIFPDGGVLSVFAGTQRDGVEVGMIGREGMTGLSVAFGGDQSVHTLRVQVPGHGLRVPVARFRALLDSHPELRSRVLRYAQAQLVQVSLAGVASARRTVTERLARWLLMCIDRAGRTELSITHETLSGALGVRRPGVTVATHLLEGSGAIRAKRGRISVLDRAKLEELANGSYGLAEREYERLLSTASVPEAAPASWAA